jgi:hypothetical protein
VRCCRSAVCGRGWRREDAADGYASIERYGRYKLLKEAPPAGGAEFQDPATGAVGLVVGTDQTRASLAEFDNFVVEQVA